MGKLKFYNVNAGKLAIITNDIFLKFYCESIGSSININLILSISRGGHTLQVSSLYPQFKSIHIGKQHLGFKNNDTSHKTSDLRTQETV